MNLHRIAVAVVVLVLGTVGLTGCVENKTRLKATPTSLGTGGSEDAARDLRDSLLRNSDFPDNWQQLKEITLTDVAVCGRTPFTTVPATERAGVAYGNDDGNILVEQLLRFAPGGAQQFIAEFASSMNGCTQFTTGSTNWSAVPVEAPPIGDEALAYDTDGTDSKGTAFNGRMLFVRRGDVVVQMIATNVLPPEITDETLNEQTTKALDRAVPPAPPAPAG